MIFCYSSFEGTGAGGEGSGALAVTFATNYWLGGRLAEDSAIALFSVLHDSDS